VSGIKGLYEGELSSARKLLDDLAKEKAKLQFENGKLKSELEETREKLVFRLPFCHVEPTSKFWPSHDGRTEVRIDI
jgi:regulator of replication initiation timing